MAKIGKLTKFLKKINSFGNKLSRSNSNVSSSDSAVTDGSARLGSDRLQTVYVGTSRREYRVDPDLLGHPAVQELVDRSDGSDQITVGCEVVLFDHLRWMIDNSDSHTCPMDDLADFYAYY